MTAKSSPGAFPIIGVIEGFYGPPWTHAARLRMIDFMAEAGFNSYCYAPKDDAYHRERWRDPYPAKDFQKLTQLINRCNERGVDFCWAVSPGLSVAYSNPRIFRVLVNKMLSVASQGVKTFALLLDDIPPDLKSAADKKRYLNLGQAHADYCNRLFTQLKKSIPGCTLFFCPTDYIGTQPTPYLEAISADLGPEIPIFWTGPNVVSPSITADDARAMGEVLGRKPLLWDNYPVNDYNRNVLNLGPLRNRDTQLGGLLAGCFANPMNEDEASKIALSTMADYMRNPAGYDADRSWKKALIHAAGGAEGAAVLRVLAEYCSNRVFPDEPKSCVPERIARAREGKSQPLLAALRKLDNISEQLRTTVHNPHLVRDLRPYAQKLERLAQALLLAYAARRVPENDKEDILRGLVPLLRGIKYDSKIVAAGVLQIHLFEVVAEIAPDLSL